MGALALLEVAAVVTCSLRLLTFLPQPNTLNAIPQPILEMRKKRDSTSLRLLEAAHKLLPHAVCALFHFSLLFVAQTISNHTNLPPPWPTTTPERNTGSWLW